MEEYSGISNSPFGCLTRRSELRMQGYIRRRSSAGSCRKVNLRNFEVRVGDVPFIGGVMIFFGGDASLQLRIRVPVLGCSKTGRELVLLSWCESDHYYSSRCEIRYAKGRATRGRRAQDSMMSTSYLGTLFCRCQFARMEQ